MDRLHELAALTRRHSPVDQAEAGPGLMLVACDTETSAQPVVYQPMFCLILEGAKRTTLGGESFTYEAGDYLIVTADLPVSAQVIRAPYAAIGIALDPAAIAELMPEPGGAASAGERTPTRGLAVSRADEALIDCVARRVRLLDQPQDATVLEPLIRREILWRLLNGERADMMRQIGAENGRLSRVRRVIRRLREHYAEPIRIEELAALAGMSETSLHRHFKAVTAMSPLQFQKQVRLQEARNLLLGRASDVAGVGFAVGYDSPSQFSREYRRQFGEPPGRDVGRLRRDHGSAAAL